jgi:drug/metabolite transporter (DMT)-like permease
LTAVAFAAVSAALFGGMSVGLRMGLDRSPDADLATLATVAGALVVTLIAAAAESPARGLHLAAAWPFVLAGLMQPGAGQIFVTRSVQEAGASRASVVLGSAPLVSVTIALVVLGEPAQAPLLVGAVLIVAGGVELARDRDRPAHVRRRGYVFAFIACVLFATRDNLVRWLSGDTSVPPAVAASGALVGGLALVVVLLGRRVRGRLALRPALPFLAVGVLFGLSYVTLFEAYFRGRVTVVSPIVATEALWGVALSWLLIRRTELVGRRVLIGALLIVGGGVLIGINAG